MVVTELADQLAEDRPLVREVDVEGPCATLALWVTSTIEARSNPLAPNTSAAASSSRRRVACPRAVPGTAGYSVRPIVLPPLAPAGTVMKAESVANLCGEGGRDRSQAELEPEIGSARCAMADPPARERPRAFWVFDRPLHRDWLFLIGLAAGVAFAVYALARPDRPAAPAAAGGRAARARLGAALGVKRARRPRSWRQRADAGPGAAGRAGAGAVHPPPRSEEHTSELQSPVHLVCRLLLEKKKTQQSTPLFQNKKKKKNTKK